MLEQRSGFSQSWFEKGQLPRPVAVELRFAQPTGGRATARIEDAAACAANRVVFARRGAAASVSPDSVPGVLDDDRCYARTYWSLGEGIGERELHISVLPGKGYKAEAQPLVANAWARATPRFVAGLAYSRLRPYLGLTPATQRSVQVEETDATGVKRTYTTNEVVRPAAVDTVGRKEQYSAVAALSIPIPIARLGDADGLSLTGGVDLAAPTNRFYAGLSVLRLFGHLNPVIESLPVDLHLLGYFARQPVLRDSNCAPADCTVRDRMRYHGLSVMLSGDATSLISELVKKLAP